MRKLNSLNIVAVLACVAYGATARADGDIDYNCSVEAKRSPFFISYESAYQSCLNRSKETRSTLPPCPPNHDVRFSYMCDTSAAAKAEPSTEVHDVLPVKGVYRGLLNEGVPNGKGTYFFTDGGQYVGNWRDGKQYGSGIEYRADGSVLRSGKWIDGNLAESYYLVEATFPFSAETPRSLVSRLDSVKTEVMLPKPALDELKSNTTSDSPKLISEAVQKPSSVDKTSPIYANRRALVIGNDTYKSIPKLLAAREDARTLASNLTAVGYQVTLKLDLTEKEMKAALRNFAAQVQGGDEVMFFFAGHGVQLGSTNYLLPTDIVGDSEAQVRDEAIQLQRVLDDMSEKKAKFTLAMIDACRDNPFKSAGRAIGGRGLAPTTAATGQMVIFSAGTGQQALDRLGNSDRNKNGLFTRVFVQEMQKPNVSIDRVVKIVRNQVAELAKSVGHEQVPAIYDQVLGDFYFKK